MANWCAKRIVLGPCLELTPLVLGPQTIPVVIEPQLAQANPELAVSSALAHGGGGERTKVLAAFAAALLKVDHQHADMYADVVLAELPSPARDYLEELMTSTSYEYQSDFARRYFDRGKDVGEANGEARGVAKGLARGEAAAVIGFLEARGTDVPDEVRARINACTDLDQLTTWIRRTVTVTTAQDLFD